MFRNLKLRNKLIAIIAAPLAALVAFAVVGVLQRRDTATTSRFDGRVITAVSSDAAVAQALEVEAALAVGSRLPQEPSRQNPTPLRDRTDAAISQLRADLAKLDPGKLSAATRSAISAMNDRLAALSNLRSATDRGGLPWPVVTDTYGQAVSSVVTVARELAGDASNPKVQSSLANLAAIGQLKADVAENGNLLTGVLSARGWPDQATHTRFLSNADTEDVDLAIFKSGATAEAAAAYRNASSTSAVSFVDSTRQAVREGNLERALAQQGRWAPSLAAKVDKLHDIENGVGAAIAADNGARIDAAERAARLFIIVAAAATLLALLVAGIAARSLARRMRGLTEAADRLSERELPRLVAALENPDEDELARLAANLEPIEVSGDDELGSLATSFNHVQRVAVEVATEQAALLQRGIADTFVKLARRNQGLLDRQIEFIDQLEMSEADPAQLEDLFKLDHLATRMRRNAESLLVLAGAEPSRRRGDPVQLASVVRAAIGEVEDFARIDLLTFDPVYVTRNASVDVTHLLAELMDNATTFSPPDSRVEVAGHRSSSGGYVLSITDNGIGMSEDQLREANELLSNPPALGLTLSRALGFIVVGRLAARFGIVVRLFPGRSGGTTAAVTLPAPLVLDQPDEAPSVEDPDGPDPAEATGAAVAASDLQQRWDIDELLAAERPADLLGLTRGADADELPQRARPAAAGVPADRSDDDWLDEQWGDGAGSSAGGGAGERAPDPDAPPPLPVSDAGVPLRFGELPQRGARPRTSPAAPPAAAPAPAPDVEPVHARADEVPAARQGAEGSGSNGAVPASTGPRSGPIPRAPIHFGANPERLRPDLPSEPARPHPRPHAPQQPEPIHGVPGALPVAEGQEHRTGGGGLARRVPRASKITDGHSPGVPTSEDGGELVAPTKRSAEEVRSLLSRYRGGLDRGRNQEDR